jgi:hypothetical protein
VANASPPAKASTPSLELFISLAAADSNLSRRGMHALLRLRSRQLEAMRGARGAFVKLEPRDGPPWLELAVVGRDSPLVADFHSLLMMQLITDFPERADDLRVILDARRNGLDVNALAYALWRDDGGEALKAAAVDHGVDPHLLAGTLWAALKPLYEAVSAAFTRHFEMPDHRMDCPVCGGTPWARCGGELRCAVCETTWSADLKGRSFLSAEGTQARGALRLYDSVSGARLMELDTALFAHAFDSGPLIELLQLLDARADS